MPDLPDIHTPLPDAAHEALRAGLVHAVDGLATEVQRINAALLLLLTTAEFAQSTLNTAIAARQTLASQQARVTALETGAAEMQAALTTLEARVAALENPAASTS